MGNSDYARHLRVIGHDLENLQLGQIQFGMHRR